MVYLYLDARYEKVRQAGSVRDAAILMASGVKKDGKRSILGISVTLSEARTHWRAFLEGLVKRGLCGVQLIISDDHRGLEAARKAVFTGIPWQRCQFHLQQNEQQYIPRVGMRSEAAENNRTIFNDPDRATADTYLKKTVEKYTPERVERITGIPADELRKAARIIAAAKTASFVYSMGITQHTTGTDNVLSVANIAMLTGNIGRPGTGVNPLRGQNNVQGACDMGALPNVYPGYQQVADEKARAKYERKTKAAMP